MESFDVRALPTAGASVTSKPPHSVFRGQASTQTRQIDSKITSLELRAPADETPQHPRCVLLCSPPRHASPPMAWIHRQRLPAPCVSGVSSALNLCARADNDMDTLAIDSQSSLSSTPTSAKSIFLVFGCPGLLLLTCPSPPACVRTLMPVIRTHDDDKSYVPLAALHCITRWFILGVIFPCSTRIPPYLRPNPRGSNAGHAYPLICPFSGRLKADLDQRVRPPFLALSLFIQTLPAPSPVLSRGLTSFQV
ncbi:hypothetical protein B0H14DRAFT_3498802 [Mycena olivaceomarginata]|nr:hypothetical protein B0H14DRAFT_3498802 [Mycena olivaceomarginata]